MPAFPSGIPGQAYVCAVCGEPATFTLTVTTPSGDTQRVYADDAHLGEVLASQQADPTVAVVVAPQVRPAL